MKWDAIRARITGPVYPVPPAFAANGAFDAPATARYVEWLVASGARAIMTTAGTSRFNLLSDEEVKSLNACVARAAGKRAVSIVGTPASGSLQTALDQARHAQDAGADILLVYFPERYYSASQVFDFYSALARDTQIGLMAHGVPLRSGTGGIFAVERHTPDLCRQLAGIPAFLGMKEEHADEALRYRLALDLATRLVFIVAGGGMRTYLGCHAYGVQAHLTGVGSLRPRIEEDFYADVKAGRLDRAFATVANVEQPLFDCAIPMGWHRAMKGMLEVLDLMPGHERAPLPACTREEKEKLRELARRLNWL